MQIRPSAYRLVYEYVCLWFFVVFSSEIIRSQQHRLDIVRNFVHLIW